MKICIIFFKVVAVHSKTMKGGRNVRKKPRIGQEHTGGTDGIQ